MMEQWKKSGGKDCGKEATDTRHIKIETAWTWSVDWTQGYQVEGVKGNPKK